jgi:hypothetical protein
LIYSRFRGDGGYDYFETPERRGLGDDLPVPRLPVASALGVPSTEAGRPMPASAKFIGRGKFAKGVIAPLDRAGLTLGGITDSLPSVVWLGIAAVIGWMIGKRS